MRAGITINRSVVSTTSEEQVPELRILLHHPARLLGSRRTVRRREEKSHFESDGVIVVPGRGL